jgi:hypothetical protein
MSENGSSDELRAAHAALVALGAIETNQGDGYHFTLLPQLLPLTRSQLVMRLAAASKPISCVCLTDAAGSAVGWWHLEGVDAALHGEFMQELISALLPSEPAFSESTFFEIVRGDHSVTLSQEQVRLLLLCYHLPFVDLDFDPPTATRGTPSRIVRVVAQPSRPASVRGVRPKE